MGKWQIKFQWRNILFDDCSFSFSTVKLHRIVQVRDQNLHQNFVGKIANKDPKRWFLDCWLRFLEYKTSDNLVTNKNSKLPSLNDSIQRLTKILTLAGSGAWVLVDDGDNVVGWVGDDSTEDTSDVTGGESDHQLFGLKVIFE